MAETYVEMTITQERAHEIRLALDWEWGGALCGRPRPFPKADEDEDRQIKAVWETMPGHTCYADAVRRIERGEYPVGTLIGRDPRLAEVANEHNTSGY